MIQDRYGNSIDHYTQLSRPIQATLSYMHQPQALLHQPDREKVRIHLTRTIAERRVSDEGQEG
jgi:hypothetical protein